MIPVDKTGLHCGAAVGSGEEWEIDVIPVDKTGLHCGQLVDWYTLAVVSVIPVDKTGLHCGYWSLTELISTPG